ncbi:tumor necrosis factor receptor superfamily member 10B-like isoform X2 [Pteropus vampyrus]|uniref:Tumor necrosis factor receptor superfamily member 10B-like isoform X2 n=1 Tax=Pteropus vampyrus TaxID=132908 RepID=A0A6P6BTD4_PTEVA|nr:tumor necrosis factor receptor superfamily member 10B-like isoform X2 [Pteropus vampyrus]
MVTPGPGAPGRLQGPLRPMKYARSLMTLPGPGALPDRTGQRGHSALASSGARAGRAPVPGPAPGAGPQLWGPRALISVVSAVFALLLAVLSASATTTGQDRVHQQLTAPPECRWSLPGKCCPPGFYLAKYTGDCMSCTDGVDFTNHRNNNSTCRRCSRCNPGEVQTRSCTRIQDTECQCKPGTYRERNSPELCRPCSSGLWSGPQTCGQSLFLVLMSSERARGS